MNIDLDRLAELAHAVPERGPWHTTHHPLGEWTVDSDANFVARACGAPLRAEPTAKYLAALDPETVLGLIAVARTHLATVEFADPKPPTLAPGDTWYPWWVMDRTGASKPKGMWSKAMGDSTVDALGDPERYVVVQGLPEE